MATQRFALDTPRSDFAEALLAEREVAPRARAIAQEAADLTGAAAAVYVFDAEAAPRWSAKASVGDISAPAACEALTLHMVAERMEGLLFTGGELVREHYSHLDVRRTVTSMAYVPLLLDGMLIGAIEAVACDRVLTVADLQALDSLTDLSAVALASALTYENERNSSLESITRLTQFYDLEKVFHSTLQMSELLPIITAKIRELFPVQAVNLWMVDGENLLLMSRDGNDPTLEVGAPADEIINAVADEGTWAMIHSPTEPRLQKRNRDLAPKQWVRTLLAVPIVHEGAVVGTIECINKSDGAAFDEDDLFFLTTVAETASLALHNASLLEAERKVEILQTLVEISSEITSTLNLERVLQVVVNAPQRIMTYDRAAVAIEDRGKLQVKAISGVSEIIHNDPKVAALRQMLEFCSLYDTELFVVGRPDRVEADREETRARFREYFSSGGMRSWYSVPLADDQGRLGILVFESADPDAFTDAQLEFVKIIAGQATVAVRNASLYQEVPLIGVLEPILKKKHEFMRLEKSRRAAYIALAVAAVLFLAFFPLPMRVAGNATVAAQTTASVQAEVDGVVRNVYIREGDRVTRGTVLADMNDWDYRADLAAAQAKYAASEAAMNRALADSDGMEAGIRRVEADYWAAEVSRARERLERTRLRSPIDGLVATPHVESLVGKKLQAGDTFGEVINAQRATIDVAVDETDLPLIHPGDTAAVKLESFPTRKFQGRVDLVSPQAAADNENRVFFARIDVPNAEGLIRPGMQGMSKIRTGWRPAGYVLFRGFALWGWNKLWSWIGW